MKPTVTLSTSNGNPFYIMGECQKVARDNGFEDEKITKMIRAMYKNGFKDILKIAFIHFEVV